MGASPVRPVHGEHLAGGLLERRDGVTPGGQGIASRPGQPAVGDGGFPGLGQGHEPDRAETQLAALAVDEEPLDPLLVSGRLDPQDQAMLVPVQSGRYCQVKQFGGILAARRHR